MFRCSEPVRKIEQVLQLDRSNVAAAASELPCTDNAFPEDLVAARLRSITEGRVDSCMSLKLGHCWLKRSSLLVLNIPVFSKLKVGLVM